MIDANRFPYQGKAEPPAVASDPPVSKDLSSWYRPTDTPVRRRGSVAAFAVSVFFVPVIQVAAIPSVDSWHPQAQVQVRIPARRPSGGETQVLTTFVIPTGVETWAGSYPNIIYRAQPRPRGGAVEPLDSRIVPTGTEAWSTQLPVSVLRSPPRPFGFIVDALPDLAAAPSVPSLDSWGATTWPTTRKETLAIAGGAFYVPFEEILVDKWYVQERTPVFKRPLVRGGQWSSFVDLNFGAAEVITLDKWEPSYDDMVLRLSRRPWTGPEFSPTLNALASEVITLDKWSQVTQRNPSRASGVVIGQWLAYTEISLPPPEIITLDKWWRQTSEPRRYPGRLEARHIPYFSRTELAIVPITWTTYGGPFLYTAANWSTSTQFFFEAFFRASSGTCRARLVNQAGNPVTGSEVSTVSSTAVRLRSGALTLTNGDEYFAQFGEETGAIGFFQGARMIAV